MFEALVEQELVEHLRPGDTVVMDNLSSHKRPATRARIEAVGAWVEFLPPYPRGSPDLNPIKNLFSKVKRKLRSFACRTRDKLWERIQEALDTVTAQDARGCYAHCGYTLQMK